MQTPPATSTDMLVRPVNLKIMFHMAILIVSIMFHDIQEQNFEENKPSLSTAETKLYQVNGLKSARDFAMI
jgi:hypothetical protein